MKQEFLPLLAVLCLFSGVACTRPARASESGLAAGGSLTSPAAVAVTKPKMEQLSRELVLSAEFRPYQVVDLHAKVAGYVRHINVDVGSAVRAGQLIAKLEIPEMEAEVALAAAERRRAEAELPRASAEVARAEANVNVLTVSLNRLLAASKAEPGLIAQQELDEINARKLAAEAQVASAKASFGVEQQRINSAKAAEQRTQTMAAYEQITAPFAGVITKRYADPGSMIQAGTASQSQAMPLVRLADISRLRLTATVPESAVPLIRPGQRVEIRVTALNRKMPGVVARLNQDVASASRTMEAEIDIANPGGSLTPGMYAEVAVNLDQRGASLTVPVIAVSNSGGNRTVLVVHDGVIEERKIQTGIETAASYEVLSGVTAADDIVIGNRSLLKAGQKVEAKAQAGAD